MLFNSCGEIQQKHHKRVNFVRDLKIWKRKTCQISEHTWLMKKVYNFKEFSIDVAKWSDGDCDSILFSINQMHYIQLVIQGQIIPLSVVKNISKTIILKWNARFNQLHAQILHRKPDVAYHTPMNIVLNFKIAGDCGTSMLSPNSHT